ncbi:MAG: hypothetical protein JJT93_03350, partial [Gammaproteobacteria bacterium]|nr:hypothetical protein [Gammaproteobacteria bacterium]
GVLGGPGRSPRPALLLLLIPMWRRAETSPQRWLGVLILVLIVPVGGAGTYLIVSTWQWDPQVRAELAVQRLRAIAADAEEGMALEDSVDGWRSLGDFYANMQDFAGAARAYGRASELAGPDDVPLALAFAEAVLFSDPDGFAQRAGNVLDAVLRRQPDNARALFYGGQAAWSAGRWDVAEARWQRLLEMEPPAAIVRMVEQRLGEIRRHAGSSTGLAEGAPGAAAGTAPPGQGDAASASVTVQVALGEGFDALIGQGAVLFVIVREGAGGPPLAVRRVPASALPGVIELGDRDVMLPDQSIANTSGPLAVVARISQTGDVAAASGDLYTEGSVLAGGEVTLVIDRVVP